MANEEKSQNNDDNKKTGLRFNKSMLEKTLALKSKESGQQAENTTGTEKKDNTEDKPVNPLDKTRSEQKSDDVEKTSKLKMTSDKEEQSLDKNTKAEPEKTLKLKPDSKQVKHKEEDSKTQKAKSTHDETVKLKREKNGTAEEDKNVKDQIAEHSKTSAGSDKSLNLKLNKKDDKSSAEQRKSSESLKRTIKLKSLSKKTYAGKQPGHLTTNTIKLSPKKTDDKRKSSSDSEKEKTIKLKTPEKKDPNLSNLSKTLKLKKNTNKKEIEDKAEGDVISTVSSTKDISPSKVIKLKTTVDEEKKVDPMSTQTIKIKSAKPDTDKKPEKKTDKKESAEPVENTAKVSLDKTEDLPSIDEGTQKQELEKKTKLFESKKEEPEEKQPEKTLKLKPQKTEPERRKPELKKEKDETVKDNKDAEKTTAPPDLGDLKNVLNDFKEEKEQKVKKSIAKSAEKKKQEVKGRVESTEEEQTTSFFTVAVGAATVIALSIVLYFVLSSYLFIS
ncbi:MAG: hypothetical protein K9L78_01835 [Victivallales bacterium]|nr:hypothetical protein [Victivallales bacterium]MCF7888837.1 hypothetical protein [Victivallales bacterium]